MKYLQSPLVNDDFQYSWIYADLIRERSNPVEAFIERARNSFEEHLRDYLNDNLKRLGYKFRSDEHFLDFLKERVQRLSFTDKPNEYEFYIDYVSETNTGKYIGSYCDETSIRCEGNEVIATFGRKTNQQKNL